MKMMKSKRYYSSEYTPLTGALKLYLLFLEIPDNYEIELYKVFAIFPLLDNEEFLKNLIMRKKTFNLYKIISDYVTIEKNKFWIEYSIKYDICKRQCFESIYFSLATEILKLKNGKLVKGRVLSSLLMSEFEKRNCGIVKLGQMIVTISYIDLLQLLKVGERCG